MDVYKIFSSVFIYVLSLRCPLFLTIAIAREPDCQEAMRFLVEHAHTYARGSSGRKTQRFRKESLCGGLTYSHKAASLLLQLFVHFWHGRILVSDEWWCWTMCWIICRFYDKKLYPRLLFSRVRSCVSDTILIFLYSAVHSFCVSAMPEKNINHRDLGIEVQSLFYHLFLNAKLSQRLQQKSVIINDFRIECVCNRKFVEKLSICVWISGNKIIIEQNSWIGQK